MWQNVPGAISNDLHFCIFNCTYIHPIETIETVKNSIRNLLLATTILQFVRILALHLREGGKA